MNIFYLHNDQSTCAKWHNDKHCVKMILEYAQLMSTAHRFLDGEEHTVKAAIGARKLKRWKLPDAREDVLYKATHINHPSAVWLRKAAANYTWLHTILRVM